MPAVCRGGRWVKSWPPDCPTSISPISGRLQSKQPFPRDEEVKAALNSKIQREGMSRSAVSGTRRTVRYFPKFHS